MSISIVLSIGAPIEGYRKNGVKTQLRYTYLVGNLALDRGVVKDHRSYPGAGLSPVAATESMRSKKNTLPKKTAIFRQESKLAGSFLPI